MAKTRGVEVIKDGNKWNWYVEGHLWELRLEPYRDRRLLRDGVTLFGPITLSAGYIRCPDDGILFAQGYEKALADPPEGGKAA